MGCDRAADAEYEAQAQPAFRDHRPLVNGIIYRYRTGCPRRDVPEQYGPWRAVWRRHSQLSSRGIWDQILVRLLAQADAVGEDLHCG